MEEFGCLNANVQLKVQLSVKVNSEPFEVKVFLVNFNRKFICDDWGVIVFVPIFPTEM